MGFVDITDKAISLESITESLKDSSTGAIVTFLGVVREVDESTIIKRLEYDCYRDMALQELNKIVAEAKSKFKVIDISAVHRIGTIYPKENVVLICVSSAHRKEAFEACEFVINEIKVKVPIWKKEVTESSKKWL